MSDNLTPYEQRFNPITPQPVKLDQDAPGPATRVDVMRKITQDLPLNELGLPNYIYRTDLIHSNLYDDYITEEERLDTMEMASIALDYMEGYPSLPDGTPFWNQLNFEPIAAFKIFTDYLGVVKREDEAGRITSPVRTLFAVSRVTALPEIKLRELSYMYYWPQRAKAYDLFMLANFQKQRETRALFVEDEQFRRAAKWVKKLEARMDEIFADEDELYELKPREVISAMKDMMTLQRISAGMPANGPAPNDAVTPGSNLANTIRGIAKRAGEESREASIDEQALDSLMQDPTAMAQLQAMIIKANVKPHLQHADRDRIEEAVVIEDDEE